MLDSKIPICFATRKIILTFELTLMTKSLKKFSISEGLKYRLFTSGPARLDTENFKIDIELD